MAEPEWAQVLAVLYTRGDNLQPPVHHSDMGDDHVLVEETNLSTKEIYDSLKFLSNQNLIEFYKMWEDTDEDGKIQNYSHWELELNPEGFEVAHEREIGIREEASSKGLIALTGVLALTGLVEASTSFTQVEGPLNSVATGGILLGTAGLFMIMMFGIMRIGLLDFTELAERINRFQ